jgi:hypothetical protein
LALWYLFLLAAIVGIAWSVWSYRKYAAEQAAASKARMQELLVLAPRTTASVVAVEAGQSLAEAQPAQVAAYVRRERLLDPSESLLFLRLKAGLPDLEIFAGVSLAAVVELSVSQGSSDSAKMSPELGYHHIDFLVCEKNFRIVAAVEFEAATESAKFKSACLASAGIRHVHVNPRAIPAKEDVDTLILGAKPDANSTPLH